MSMRSSMDRPNNRGSQARSIEAATKSASRSVRQPKRWQARTLASKHTIHQKTVASKLNQAEWDNLLRQQALSDAQQGNWASAIALFTELIERNPYSANDYNNRGLVFFQSGQLDAAIADYDKAIEINPCLDSAYNNRANYYASQGQFLEAILDYDIAIDLNPSNIRAWINQGITFRDLKMFERAIESFELALCFNQLEGHIYAERGRTYHLWGDWNCAFADYRRALEMLPVEGISAIATPSIRLRRQVETWMDELLSPLQF